MKNHGPWPSRWHDHIGIIQKNLQDLMELKNVAQFGFKDPGINLPCVSERILEVNFISPQDDDYDPDQ